MFYLKDVGRRDSVVFDVRLRTTVKRLPVVLGVAEVMAALDRIDGKSPAWPFRRRDHEDRGVRVHAPYATTDKWGFLHEALVIDGVNDAQLLITSAINQDIHAVFLKQIADSDPDSLHVVIADQAGYRQYYPHPQGSRRERR